MNAAKYKRIQDIFLIFVIFFYYLILPKNRRFGDFLKLAPRVGGDENQILIFAFAPAGAQYSNLSRGVNSHHARQSKLKSPIKGASILLPLLNTLRTLDWKKMEERLSDLKSILLSL